MEILLIATSSLCAGVPMIGMLALVWWLDRYDREPVWLLSLTFLWGAIGSILFSLFGAALVQIAVAMGIGMAGAMLHANVGQLLAASGPVLVAPLTEEPAKAIVLLLVIYSRHFDNMTDGFVYGAAAGLGFGMTENFMYFVTTSGDLATWGGTVVVRTLYSAVMHATSTAIVGAALGWARFRGPVWLLVSGTVGLALAMAVHGMWNGLLTLDEIRGTTDLFTLNLYLFPAEVAMTFAVFQLCLWEESMTLARELGEEAASGVIPAEHPGIIASYLRRHDASWLPTGVDHEAYVEAATQLAMRKKQVRQMGGAAPDFYRDDVIRLRDQLRSLLASGGSSG